MVKETARSWTVRLVRRWRFRVFLALAAALILIPLSVWLGRRSSSPPPPLPAAAPEAVPRVEVLSEKRRLLAECMRRRELKATPAELEEIDRKFELHLGTLPPAEVLALLSEGVSGVVLPLVLRAVANGLAADRPLWERAFAESLGGAGNVPGRLEGMAVLFFGCVRDTDLRASTALLLATAPEAGGGLVLAAREAPPEARRRIRQVLWARVADPGAVEALGEIVEAAEADRLASLGPRPEVRRALKAAFERTGAVEFREALELLR